MRKKTHPKKIRGERTRKKIVLFTAEGGHNNKTETNYLRNLVKDIGNIKLIRTQDASTDPIRMVESLISTMADIDFDPSLGDLAFCIFDMDCDKAKEKQVQEAQSIAQKKGIVLIMSNPCFELWYVCHYTETPKLYASSKDLLKDMNLFIPGYKKQMENVFLIVKEKTGDAIRNAENLENKAIEKGYRKYSADFSPTTEMYKLVKQIIESDKKNKSS